MFPLTPTSNPRCPPCPAWKVQVFLQHHVTMAQDHLTSELRGNGLRQMTGESWLVYPASVSFFGGLLFVGGDVMFLDRSESFYTVYISYKDVISDEVNMATKLNMYLYIISIYIHYLLQRLF